MVNRSCINTCSFSCRNLTQIPAEIKEASANRLNGIQKIDLSFNNLVSIAGIQYDQLYSLKELMINDNQISEIPHHSLSNCKQLRLINITNNQLTLLPPLTTPSFILAKGNPLRLITSQLKKLTQLEFVTFDWLEYLLDAVTSELSNDRFKDYAKDFSELKKTILEKVDYSKEENCSYCDFHCLFNVRMDQWKNKKEGIEGMLAMHAARAILRGDSFFLNYLRNFHNEVNYAALTYNSRLLLETAL
jgi:Leucine-rich repeat (LRR) protein